MSPAKRNLLRPAQSIRAKNKPSKTAQARDMFRATPDIASREVASRLGLSLRNVQEARAFVRREMGLPAAEGGAVAKPILPKEQPVTVDMGPQEGTASSCTTRIKTAEQLLRAAHVDLKVWEIERQLVNKWEVGAIPRATGSDSRGWRRGSTRVMVEPLFQVKVWLRRKAAPVVGAEEFIARLERAAPFLPIPAVRRRKLPHRRAFELDIMDPHIGLLCQPPEADKAWNLELAEAHIMAAVDDLTAKASAFGPFEQAFMPFGNDWTHADNVNHTTTAGTGQPEAIAWHHVYVRAKQIAIRVVTRLREIAQSVHVYEVPGNHSRHSDFTLAHVLEAYFRHDRGVHVDASSSPYKFHRFGANLIGFEHGHSISPIRLAALMANECPDDWAATEFREFHLGDQHRRGSSNPAALEEQGVSVEYIPGLVAPNEWHRLKAFNHQKAGAMAFVYDYHTGPVARIQHNVGRFVRLNLKKAA
jgi:hypothetical protein